MKRVLVYGVSASLLGCLLSSWLGSKVIGWWFRPPAAGPVDCTPMIAWGMNRLLLAQAAGAVAGFILGLALAFALRENRPA